jgi:hypothetical protein
MVQFLWGKFGANRGDLPGFLPLIRFLTPTAAPILAFYPYYYSRPGHSVSVVGGLFPGAIECRGAVSPQTVGVLPGTPGSAPQAHRRSALLPGAMVSTIQLESVIDDRQAGDPHRLASQELQAVLAVEVAVGTTADSEKSSPADCAHGAGEPDLGRGARRRRTVGEARDPGFATNGAGVLAGREGSARR